MSDILKNKTVYILTLGCKVNKYESDAMLEELKAAGCIALNGTENEGQTADISIVNTCSVTNIADRKSRQMLHKVKKMNPGTVVVAVGCYVQAAADTLQNDESVDIVVGNNRKKDIVRIIEEFFEGKEVEDNLIDINHDNTYENLSITKPSEKTRAYIKIQDGCNLFCTYCIIPYVRGRIRSKSVEDVINEMNSLADNGIKEIVLTGINLSSYDDNGRDFNYLLKEFKRVSDKIKRIRLGSLEPRMITEEFVEIIKNDERFCPHFHLSLQSVCDNTLKRMNRHYTVDDVKAEIALLRQNFDRPAITADIIAGFAGETEEDFNTTLDNLTELKLYETHVFKFSRRKGTVADNLPGQLTRISSVNQAAFERSFKGETINVLVEEIIEKEGTAYFRGHTERYMLVDVKCSDVVKDENAADFINQIISVVY